MNAILRAITWPTTVAHEAAHAAVIELAGPDESELVIRSDTPRYRADGLDDASKWLLRLGYLAPTIVGSLFALIVGVHFVVGGGELPTGVYAISTWALAAAYWFTFTVPSPRDIAGALNP